VSTLKARRQAMKKKIIILSVVLICVIGVLTGNCWAQRERGDDRHPALNGSGEHNFDKDRSGPRHHSGQHFYRPGPGFKSKFDAPRLHRPADRFNPKFHNRHLYRAPDRHWPKFRPWRHRPVYRKGHPVSYSEPGDAFAASATIVDSGFAFSIGISETN
jgi:hypothetical protein